MVKKIAPADRLITMPEGLPDFTLGWEVVKWARRYLVHPNGPRQGLPWEFIKTQLRFLLWWYAVDHEGRWLFNHAVRRLTKSSGKSPFAALISLAELTAPVRFDYFDPAVPGGVVGKSVAMPWVQIAATAESQTANTMRMVHAMAAKTSKLTRAFNLDPARTRVYIPPAGKLEIITASSTAAEGAETTFTVADETELWKPGNGGPDLAATLLDNLAKSGSRMLETCNAWVPGQDSVSESSYLAWVAQEEGRTKGKLKTLYDARIARPDIDLSDEVSLMENLKFVYDDCFWVDLEWIKERIWSPNSRPDESLRKYFNLPTGSSDAWCEQREWSAIASPETVISDHDEIVIFLDGSKSRDATAIVGCRMSDGHVFEIGVWEPDRNDPESVVPVNEVDAAVQMAFDRWNVVAFFSDVREWESWVHSTWPERYKDDLLLWATPSGKSPSPIGWDMRSKLYDFTRAAEACLAEILEKQFSHDGSSVIGRHVTNARNRANRWGYSIGKETPDSPHKIDAAVCVIGARMVRRLVLASPEWEKRKSKSARSNEFFGSGF